MTTLHGVIRRARGQSELESRAKVLIGIGPEPSRMILNDGSADGESHSQSLSLGRIK